MHPRRILLRNSAKIVCSAGGEFTHWIRKPIGNVPQGQAMNEREIYIGALEKPSPAERAAFLDGACLGDEAFRRRVRAGRARACPAGVPGSRGQGRAGPVDQGAGARGARRILANTSSALPPSSRSPITNRM